MNARWISVLALLVFPGCQGSKSGEKAPCRSQSQCKKGLGCSKDGFCHRLVDCQKLEARLEGCALFLLAELEPSVLYLSQARSKKLLEPFKARLDKEIVQPCKQGTERSKDASALNNCLEKNDCQAFARCVLLKSLVLKEKVREGESR